MSDGPERSLGAQIQEVQRELALRERVYGRAAPNKRGENEEHMARMKAVLRTLLWLQKNETKIRAHLALEKIAGKVDAAPDPG